MSINNINNRLLSEVIKRLNMNQLFNPLVFIFALLALILTPKTVISDTLLLLDNHFIDIILAIISMFIIIICLQNVIISKIQTNSLLIDKLLKVSNIIVKSNSTLSYVLSVSFFFALNVLLLRTNIIAEKYFNSMFSILSLCFFFNYIPASYYSYTLKLIIDKRSLIN